MVTIICSEGADILDKILLNIAVTFRQIYIYIYVMIKHGCRLIGCFSKLRPDYDPRCGQQLLIEKPNKTIVEIIYVQIFIIRKKQ